MKMGEIIDGEKCGKALKTVLLSNSAVMHCTASVLQNVREQLQTRIKCSSKFAPEVNGSTRIPGIAQILACVRNCFEEDTGKRSCSGCCFQRDVQAGNE
jgi:hypothetical protein